MSVLVSWPAADPGRVLVETSDPERIAAELAGAGCRFERREVRPGLAADAEQARVLEAYGDVVEAEVAARGFVLADVAGISPAAPGYPERAPVVRDTFIHEHTHGDDDEVRFITRGSGVFYLHIGDRVHALLAEAGDLTGVPRGTMHWFDTGARPDFTAIRFFHEPQGWVAVASGSDISGRFPDADQLRARALR